MQLYTLLGGGMVPEGPYQPLNDAQRSRLYWRDTYVNPAAYIIPWITALPDTARQFPREWTGFEGYAKRAGARFIGDVAGRSVAYPMHNLMNTEPRYIPCRCDGGFFKRFGHAVAYYYVTVNEDGKKRPNIPRFLGTYAGQFATHALYPGDYDEWRAARRATGTMIWGWWLNVLREFRPEIVSVFR
ncbi:MAG: hypothetical protein GY953_27230 [bacterium]|nr:hypothetical protein [bacterium]